ncbi:diguanylate cyclase [Psychromonas sp. MME1]|uniref:diguanylate cyclase n=1 Tax=Psychromonas sp. MME1 TaxID=3231032 RepID=UPI0034E26217
MKRCIRYYLELIFAVLALSVSLCSYACKPIITPTFANISKDILIRDLLVLSLSKVIEAENICVKPYIENLSDARKSKHVMQGLIDVTWASASAVEEDNLQAIRIPIFRGLQGLRIFIIRENEQTLFDAITTLDHLRQYQAGQGTFWGDTKVLKGANIPVITTPISENLLSMLAKKRFDYFPLAIHEPWVALSAHPELPLVVENSIILSYPSAFYFYVSKDNQTLASNILNGMKIAIADGSYDQLLFSSDLLKEAFLRGNLTQRKVFSVQNSNFHHKIPKENRVYWLSADELITMMSKNR